MVRTPLLSYHRNHTSPIIENHLSKLPYHQEREYKQSNHITHIAKENWQVETANTGFVAFDPSREKCTCEKLNFCEVHTNSKSIKEKTLNHLKTADIKIGDVELSVHSKNLRIAEKVHNSDLHESIMNAQCTKVHNFPLELRPIINSNDIDLVDSKSFPCINFEIKKPTNTETRQNKLKNRHIEYQNHDKCKKGTYNHKDSTLSACISAIDGGPDVYRNLLGPTPDESILVGLQTVYDMYSNNTTISKKHDELDNTIDSSKHRSFSTLQTKLTDTYTNYSDIYTVPNVQHKCYSNFSKDKEDIFYTPRDKVSTATYSSTYSGQAENISHGSFSEESSDFHSINQVIKKSFATLSPCHFNPMQITPTTINVCDRICFSETSAPTGATVSNKSVDITETANKGKSSKKSKSKKAGDKLKSKDKTKKTKDKKSDKKSNKSSKSAKSAKDKPLKAKNSKASKISKDSTSSKSSAKSSNSKSSKKASKSKPSKGKSRDKSSSIDAKSSKKTAPACDDPGPNSITLPSGDIKLVGPCYPVWTLSIAKKSQTDLPHGIPIFRLSCQEELPFQSGHNFIDPFTCMDVPINNDKDKAKTKKRFRFGKKDQKDVKNDDPSRLKFIACINGAEACTNCKPVNNTTNLLESNEVNHKRKLKGLSQDDEFVNVNNDVNITDIKDKSIIARERRMSLHTNGLNESNNLNQPGNNEIYNESNKNKSVNNSDKIIENSMAKKKTKGLQNHLDESDKK